MKNNELEARIKQLEKQLLDQKAETKLYQNKYNELLKKYEALNEKHIISTIKTFVPKSEKINKLLEIDDAEKIIKREYKSKVGETHKKRFESLDLESKVSETIVLKPDQDICQICGSKLVKISEKVTYKIEIIKQDFKVIKYVKENYKCPDCNKENNKIYYPISNFIFPNSILTNSFASFIAMYRYDLGIPFDHLSKHISTQIGIPVSKQCLANYMSRLSELLLPIYERMKIDLIHNNEKVIHADETTLVISKKPFEDKNRKKCYIFLYSSSFYGNQINIYDFKKSRNASTLIQFLEDFNGTVVCDDYAGYDTLRKQNKNIKLQRCWAHVRRRFADIVKVVPKEKESSSNAVKILKLIEQLFNFEKIYLESKINSVDLVKYRNNNEKPIIDELYQLICVQKYKPGTAIDSAVNYAKNIWNDLLVYLDDGCVDLSNNIAERAIKPFVLQRKVFMTSGSYDGAQIMAIIFSIIRTAKINFIDINKYLNFVIENINTEKIDNLLPYSKFINNNFNINKK